MVDFLWYRKKVPGAWTDASGLAVIDEYGGELSPTQIDGLHPGEEKVLLK